MVRVLARCSNPLNREITNSLYIRSYTVHMTVRVLACCSSPLVSRDLAALHNRFLSVHSSSRRCWCCVYICLQGRGHTLHNHTLSVLSTIVHTAAATAACVFLQCRGHEPGRHRHHRQPCPGRRGLCGPDGCACRRSCWRHGAHGSPAVECSAWGELLNWIYIVFWFW